MWTNLLILLLNSVLLLLTLTSRMALHGGSIESALMSLPWQSFGTELGEMLWADTVSSAALTTGWIALTLGWIALTLAFTLKGRMHQGRVVPSKVKRPEPDFITPAPLPAVTLTAPEHAAPEPFAPPQPAPSSASGGEVTQQLVELRQRAARLSPEAQYELERLQSALTQLLKT